MPSNLAKTHQIILQVELKEHVCLVAVKPAGIRFDKRVDQQDQYACAPP